MTPARRKRGSCRQCQADGSRQEPRVRHDDAAAVGSWSSPLSSRGPHRYDWTTTRVRPIVGVALRWHHDLYRNVPFSEWVDGWSLSLFFLCCVVSSSR